ncbi:MAG: histidine kinase [Chitinispirillales bacterium]|jgi:sensor histidine kinase YesM|nr:histidine kinase [Chitinispirillales bacterium]
MHKIIAFFTVLFFCTIPNASPQYSFKKNTLTDINIWKCGYSDNSFGADFASPRYDDGEWHDKKIIGLWKADKYGAKGIRWFRTKIFITQDILDYEKAAIFIPTVISAYEIYWDGTKIGENGKIGDYKMALAKKETGERIGNSAGIFVIPQQFFSAGEHTLAIRISNFSAISGFIAENPKIGTLENVISHISKTIAYSAALIGIFFITALFNIIFIAKSLHVRAHVTYAMFSLCCCGHVFVPIFVMYYQTNLEHYYLIALLNDAFEIGLIWLLPTYLLRLFNAKRLILKSSIFFAVSTIAVMLPRLAIYDISPISTLAFLGSANEIFTSFSAITSVGIALEALFKKEKGAKTITIGLIIFWLCIVFSIILKQINISSLGFALLSAFITITMGRFFWEEMGKKSLIEIKNTRLELELLKNNIHPHFLLNSLNTIVAWIEEDPKIAVKLVNELSKELRLLMSFSQKKIISLSEEVSLCRAHLKVMNLRREKNIKLKISGDIEGITIPPLIVHTALENGLTHGFVKKDTGTFDLSVTRQAQKIIINLENNGENNHSQNRVATGTGNKYIVQRLEEIYGNNFKFVSEAKNNGWRVIFELPAERV